MINARQSLVESAAQFFVNEKRYWAGYTGNNMDDKNKQEIGMRMLEKYRIKIMRAHVWKTRLTDLSK